MRMSNKTPAQFTTPNTKAKIAKKAQPATKKAPVDLDEIIDADDGQAELSEYNGKPMLKMQFGKGDFGLPLGQAKLTCILKNLSSIKRFVASSGQEA